MIAAIREGVVRIESPTSQGSGFIFEDGWIVTNAHVVSGHDDVKVTVGGSLDLTGIVVGFNEIIDLAVVKVELPSNATVLSRGSSGGAQIGEQAWALGFPGSADSTDEITVTGGLISSKRQFGGMNYLQIDAAINPGSSGGPLINSRGEVLGITTFRIEEDENVGFALAMDEANNELDGLMAGRVVLLPEPELAPLVTYTEPREEWSIQYPEDWIVGEFEEDRRPGYFDVDRIRFSDPNFFRQVDLIVVRMIGQESLVETAKELKSRFTKDSEASVEGWTRINTASDDRTGSIEIDEGRDAEIAIATSGSENGPQFYWAELFTVSRNDNYYIVMIASESDWDDFEGQYIKIISTLKIDD